jgi:hypothetical protein
MTLIKSLKLTDDMGSDLYDNIRQGNWLLDYIHKRIATSNMPALSKLCSFMEEQFTLVKGLPVPLRPKFACMLVEKLYCAAVHKLAGNTGDGFKRSLQIACAQMYGRVPSAGYR